MMWGEEARKGSEDETEKWEGCWIHQAVFLKAANYSLGTVEKVGVLIFWVEVESSTGYLPSCSPATGDYLHYQF